MSTARELAAQHHPYMGQSLVDLIGDNIEIGIGNFASRILNCKSTGEIKEMCQIAIKLSIEADNKLRSNSSLYNKVPNTKLEVGPRVKGKRKGRGQ